MHFMSILAHQSWLTTYSDTGRVSLPFTQTYLKNNAVTVNPVFSIFFPCHAASIFHRRVRVHTMPAVHVRRHCLLFISVNHGPRAQHLPFTRRLQELTHALVPPWQNDWQAALVKLHQGGWGTRRACVCVSYLSVTRSCPRPDENSLSLQFEHSLAYSTEGENAGSAGVFI